jgi:hypothetical protein
MRNPTLTIVLLVLFGIVPLVLWAWMAASLDPAGLGRNIGKAILVVLSPFVFAGLLMIVGSAMFNRTLRAGRIMATVGAGIVVAGTGFFGLLWLGRAARCVERASLCNDLLMQGGGVFLYAVAHVALIALIWRARRGEVSSAI